jgi:hypothetical protein
MSSCLGYVGLPVYYNLYPIAMHVYAVMLSMSYQKVEKPVISSLPT